MARLENNFAIMLAVQFNGSQEALSNIGAPLADSRLNILSLESNLGINQPQNTYSIHIEGTVSEEITPLYEVLERLSDEKNIQSQLIPINSQVI